MIERLWFAVICVVLVIGGIGCNASDDAEMQQQKQTDIVLSEINRQIGLPNIRNFQQKKIMKMIYEECDREDLLCYVYIVAQYSGKLVFIGKCIGYGVPFSAQYTNPQKFVIRWFSGTRYTTTLPQADPNGLYMPTSSSATWLLMIDPRTRKPRVVYLEPEIVVSPFPLTSDTPGYDQSADTKK